MWVTGCVLNGVNLPFHLCDGTGEPLELRQEFGEPKTEQDGDEHAPNESLPGFVRREGKERFRDQFFAQSYACEVSANVVHDHKGGGEEEPEEAIEDWLGHITCLEDDDHDGGDGPHNELHLVTVVSCSKSKDCEYKQDGI